MSDLSFEGGPALSQAELLQTVELWEQCDAFLSGEAGRAQPQTTADKAAVSTRRQLAETGVELSEAVYVKRLRKDRSFAYYYLKVPLTVFPPPGTAISAIEVELQFNPGSLTERPVVHDIFPRREWQDTLEIRGGLRIGIDEALTFASALMAGAAGTLPAPFIEQILTIPQGAELQIEPSYAFLLRRPIILTSIPGSDVARWRFNGRDHFEQPEHLNFGIVLKVPLALHQVRAVPMVKARRRNQSLGRLLAHDIERFQQVRDLLAQVFQQGNVDLLLERMKTAARSEWNVVQSDLPVWVLDKDMTH